MSKGNNNNLKIRSYERFSKKMQETLIIGKVAWDYTLIRKQSDL